MPAVVGLAATPDAPAPAAAPEDPAAKVRKLKGPDYPVAGDPPEKFVAYFDRMTRATDPESQARFRQGTRNLLYLGGRQYLTWSKRTRAYEDLPLLDEKDVRVTVNYIKPILRSKTQRMLSGPVQFSAKPGSNALDARDRANLGASVIQSRHELTDMRAKTDQALELAFACGVAFWKSYWNPNTGRLTPATMQVPRQRPMLDEQGQPMVDPATGKPATELVTGEDGAPIYDTVFVNEARQPVENETEAFHYHPGDSDTAVRSIFNVRINPEATAFDPGAGLRWLLDTDVISVETAKEMFPEFADRIAPDAAADSVALTLERIAASAHTASTQTTTYPGSTAPNKKDVFPRTTIQEYWELPNSCYRKGRLVVRVGRLITYDGEFPWGVFPYTAVYDEPAPLTPMGRPCINDMVSPQDLINRQWTTIDAESRQSGYGKYAAFDLVGIPEQLTPEDRTVIRVPLNTKTMNRSIRDLFTRLEPGQAGADRWRIIDTALRALFDVAAFHEVSRGQVPPGVDSGVAIEHLLEEDRGQLAKAMRALEASLLDWGKKQLAICRWGYADQVDRWVPVDRPDLGYMLESADGVELPDPDALTLQLEGFKPQSEAAYKAEVKEALQLKLIGPREALRLLDMGRGLNAAFDSESRHYGRAMRINLAIERGQFTIKPPPPLPEGPPLPGEPELLPQVCDANGMPFCLPDDDNHPIHLLVLDEIVLDDTKPAEMRAIAQLLKAERRQILQAAMAAAPPAA